MVKIFLLLFICLISISLSAQRHSLNYYLDETESLKGRFYRAISTEGAWRPYDKNISDLLEELNRDLKAQSGFSFEEMNTARTFKSTLSSMSDFGDGVAVSGYNQMFNGRMLMQIQKVFPDVRLELIKDYNNCVKMYKIAFNDYQVLFLRHNSRGTLVKVTWSDKQSKCKTIGGYLNVIPGVFRMFWDNGNCRTNTGGGVALTGCAFEMLYDEKYSPVKTFVED